MSGGIAFVYDPDGTFPGRCNPGNVDVKPLHEKSIPELRRMLERHLEYTRSTVAERILDRWDESLSKFVRVMPRDYARVLREMKRALPRSSAMPTNNNQPAKEKGFMTYTRETPPYAPPTERLKHYDEFLTKWAPEKTRAQGYRCMNCGVPFCMSGCPLGNIIPDFNDLVKDDKCAMRWTSCSRRIISQSSRGGYARRRASRHVCWGLRIRR